MGYYDIVSGYNHRHLGGMTLTCTMIWVSNCRIIKEWFDANFEYFTYFDIIINNIQLPRLSREELVFIRQIEFKNVCSIYQYPEVCMVFQTMGTEMKDREAWE